VASSDGPLSSKGKTPTMKIFPFTLAALIVATSLSPTDRADQDVKIIPPKSGATEKTSAKSSLPKVRLLSLEVSKAVSELESKGNLSPQNGQPRNGLFLKSAGTELGILVSDPQRRFIGFDEEASRIKRFADDRDDLEGDAIRGGSLHSWPHDISSDGHYCVIHARASQTPSLGAVKIMLEAEFVLRCASGEKTAEGKNLDLKSGGELNFGGLQIDVAETKNSMPFFNFGNADPPKMSVKFTSSSSMDGIKKIIFLTTDGKEIKHRHSGSGSTGINNQRTYTMEFGLEKKVEMLTVRVTYYEKIESVAVPVTLEAGVGF
jgi:hypothetical protein